MLIDLKQISTSTIVRTVVLIFALINQVLSATGHSVLPIEDAQIEQFITLGLTIVASLISWWKNNSITTAAVAADKQMKQLKEAENKK